MNPSMRLKVKGDTFFLPDPDGGVYFRNNAGSFRMEGGSIAQWIEKLLPMFNGEHTMEELTDGLPDPHRARVYEIAEVLNANGFVRDVSRDLPHRLPEGILRKYASQVEYLDSFGGSGAYRFQLYREAKVLAVGAGPFFVSLAKSLLESGLPRISMLITDPGSTDRQRVAELIRHAREADPEAGAEELGLPLEGSPDWRAAIRPFDWILYVSEESGLAELKALRDACRAEKKALLPAMILRQAGVAGPLLHPDSDGDGLESAWRRIHSSALLKDPRVHTGSSVSEAMLANILAFELLKAVAGAAEPAPGNKLFLLDLETLEGSWHTFLPHPLANRALPVFERIGDVKSIIGQRPRESDRDRLFSYFARLTSAATGIFHVWDEGELRQLPLSQCRVQAADPLSEGPAGLLPEIVCMGLKHDEARKEAGLAGIEAYVSRLAGPLVSELPVRAESGASPGLRPFGHMGVGTGESAAEGVRRALQKCVDEERRRRLESAGKFSVRPVRLSAIDDERCRFYMKALTTMQGAPKIGLGEEIAGFPSVWVGTGGRWYGSADLNVTLALRKALERALLEAQNRDASHAVRTEEPVIADEAPLGVAIPACDEPDEKLLRAATDILERHRVRLQVYDLTLEPFLQEELAGAFGAALAEEVSL